MPAWSSSSGCGSQIAAGLAISERFIGPIRGLDQAVRNANDGIARTAPLAHHSSGGSDLDVSSILKSTDALQTADSALAFINGKRAKLGATQSRFETAISNLQVTSENLSALRGRILDADFTAETANPSLGASDQGPAHLRTPRWGTPQSTAMG